MERNQRTPDLQSILATLAQFTPTSQQDSNNVPNTESSSLEGPLEENCGTRTSQPRIADDAYDPRAPVPHLRRALESNASPKTMIDPAQITSWQEGLRCVTKLAAQNARFGASIQRMMGDQRRSELRWYEERQQLKQRQARRGTLSDRATSILSSLSERGGGSPASSEASFDNEKELTAFDRQIYIAQQDAEIAMTAELKALGVPFFGTDRSLVIPDGGDGLKDKQHLNRPKWSIPVTERELLMLRRRMVSHLEDLYRD